MLVWMTSDSVLFVENSTGRHIHVLLERAAVNSSSSTKILHVYLRPWGYFKDLKSASRAYQK